MGWTPRWGRCRKGHHRAQALGHQARSFLKELAHAGLAEAGDVLLLVGSGRQRHARKSRRAAAATAAARRWPGSPRRSRRSGMKKLTLQISPSTARRRVASAAAAATRRGARRRAGPPWLVRRAAGAAFAGLAGGELDRRRSQARGAQSGVSAGTRHCWSRVRRRLGGGWSKHLSGWRRRPLRGGAAVLGDPPFDPVGVALGGALAGQGHQREQAPAVGRLAGPHRVEGALQALDLQGQVVEAGLAAELEGHLDAAHAGRLADVPPPASALRLQRSAGRPGTAGWAQRCAPRWGCRRSSRNNGLKHLGFLRGARRRACARPPAAPAQHAGKRLSAGTATVARQPRCTRPRRADVGRLLALEGEGDQRVGGAENSKGVPRVWSGGAAADGCRPSAERPAFDLAVLGQQPQELSPARPGMGGNVGHPVPWLVMQRRLNRASHRILRGR